MSIYLDNSSTTLHKPPQVAQAVAQAIGTCGNAGRSFYDAANKANRTIHIARMSVARLLGLTKAGSIALTSSFTEGLNLLVISMLSPGDEVIITSAEHNAVLRPLKLLDCSIKLIKSDADGLPDPQAFKSTVSSNTRAMFINHASNVTGRIADAQSFGALCREAGIPLVLDVAQSLGHVPVEASMCDIAVFTGHKGLFGPQGTGGIALLGNIPLKRIAKTGGTGFGRHDVLAEPIFPDAFEAGTPNSHSFAGLVAGIDFLNRTGIEKIHSYEISLWRKFVQGVLEIPGIQIYGLGDISSDSRAPVVSLNLGDMPAGELGLRLWEEYGIATRPGSHCAPLLHRLLGTEERGTVRFSMSWFSTDEDIDTAISALRNIAK